MVTMNSFDLLGDVDNDDPTQVIALLQQKIANKKSVVDESHATAPANFPSKPIPPSQAVKEARKEGFAGPRGRGGRGTGFGRNSDSNGNVNGFSGGNGGVSEDNEQGRNVERERGSYRGSRQPYRGGRGGGYVNGDSGGDFERTAHRQFDRQSRNGHGYDRIKRDGAGRGNWGTSDGLVEQKSKDVPNNEGRELIPEKEVELRDAPASDANKEGKEGEPNDVEEKEPEDKEMTLEAYEKVLEEKRKALVAMKTEERKVDIDKEFESMQQLSLKKGNNEIFIKLGSDKDSGKRKEDADRDERVKKSVSINEFLKPVEGERHYRPGGRRGSGRGDRGQPRGFGGGGSTASSPAVPSIEDPGQFPTLGGKK